MGVPSIKKLSSVLVLAIFLCLPNLLHSQPVFHRLTASETRAEIIKLARECVGIKEVPKGSNWGRDVQAFLWHVKIKFPAPWCAAFLAYLFHQNCVDIPFSGYVPNWSIGEFKPYVKYNSFKDGKLSPKDIYPGDLGTIYFPSMKRAAHIFIIIEVHATYVVTVEGNSNSGGSREGWIVVLKQRSLNEIYQLIRIDL